MLAFSRDSFYHFLNLVKHQKLAKMYWYFNQSWTFYVNAQFKKWVPFALHILCMKFMNLRLFLRLTNNYDDDDFTMVVKEEWYLEAMQWKNPNIAKEVKNYRKILTRVLNFAVLKTWGQSGPQPTSWICTWWKIECKSSLNFLSWGNDSGHDPPWCRQCCHHVFVSGNIPLFSSTKCEVTIYDMFEQDWSDRTTNNVIPTSKPCAMTTIVFPPVNPDILDVYVMQCF